MYKCMHGPLNCLKLVSLERTKPDWLGMLDSTIQIGMSLCWSPSSPIATLIIAFFTCRDSRHRPLYPSPTMALFVNVSIFPLSLSFSFLSLLSLVYLSSSPFLGLLQFDTVCTAVNSLCRYSSNPPKTWRKLHQSPNFIQLACSSSSQINPACHAAFIANNVLLLKSILINTK